MIVLVVIHVLVALALVGAILLQKKEGGIGGLGGGGSGGLGGLMSGRAKADGLSKMTGILATAFFVTSLALALDQHPQLGAERDRARNHRDSGTCARRRNCASDWNDGRRSGNRRHCAGGDCTGSASDSSGAGGGLNLSRQGFFVNPTRVIPEEIVSLLGPPDSFHKVGPCLASYLSPAAWFLLWGRGYRRRLLARSCRPGASRCACASSIPT